MKSVIKPLRHLSMQHYQDISELFKNAEKIDGFRTKLYKSHLLFRVSTIAKDFLFYQNRVLCGYLGLFEFADQQLEVCALVRPDCRRQHIFKKLLQSAELSIEKLQARSLLFPCPAQPVSESVMRKLGAQQKNNEYTLRFSTDSLTAAHEDKEITLLRAQAHDLHILAQLDADCFQSNASETHEFLASVFDDTDRAFYLISYQNELIGKFHLKLSDESVLLTNFCISPNHRGKHLGQRALKVTLQLMKDSDIHIVETEVSGENTPALSLYQQAGFALFDTTYFWILHT